MSFKKRTLLVIITDKLSEFVSMGSLTEKFYNTGDFFDVVHILMLNDDKPNPDDIQKSVGTAKLYLHNLPINKKWIMFATLFWRPFLFKLFIKPAVKLANDIKPDLIHCHGSMFGGFIAAKIKEKLNIPYVVTLHCTKYASILQRLCEPIIEIAIFFGYSIYKYGLKNANLVITVYKSIISELKDIGVDKYNVCYLPINTTGLVPKKSYELHSPIRIISVGRQLTGKVPDKIIEAISKIDNVKLTLIGTGAKHDYLKLIAKKNNAEDKIEFIPVVSIETLCMMLFESDIFVAHNNYWGISRATLEAVMVGLPVVHNRCTYRSVEEYDDCESIVQVENDVESYYNAIIKLINDKVYREKIGRKTLEYAVGHWSPEQCEKRICDIYKSILRIDD